MDPVDGRGVGASRGDKIVRQTGKKGEKRKEEPIRFNSISSIESIERMYILYIKIREILIIR